MISIAIDGPSGAGKSTMARAAAKRLGFIYIDTGALYRSIGLYALRAGVDTIDKQQVYPLLDKIDIELKFVNNEQRVLLNGEDVSELIRTDKVSMAASNVSALPQVRSFLFDLQRSFAKKYNVIMDGRDIGTVVLPNAQLKIFLTADAAARARRRYDELVLKGQNVTYEEVLADLEKRDYNDSHREIAPLKPAEDSVLVNTTEMSVEQSVDKITQLCRETIEGIQGE